MIPLTRGPRRSQIVKTGSGSVVAGAGGGNASWCLMGTEFQAGKIQKFYWRGVVAVVAQHCECA